MMDPTWTDVVTAIGTAAYATFTFLTVLVLTGAVLYARSQVRAVEKTRRLNLLLRLAERWESLLLRRARGIVYRSGRNFGRDIRSYKKKGGEDYFCLVALANFFEDMAILMNENQISLSEIKGRFKSAITYYYDQFEDYIRAMQKAHPTNYECFADLARKLKCEP